MAKIQLKSSFRHCFAAIAGLVLLSGCVTVAQKQADTAAVSRIKSAVLVERSEPTKYSMRPGSSGTAQAVGFAVAGLSGIALSEVVRELAATSEFTKLMLDARASPNARARESAQKLLANQGLSVRTLPAGKVSLTGDIDYASLRAEADAILDIGVSGGWWVDDKNQIVPNIVVVAVLASAKSGDILFKEQYCYGVCEYKKIDYVQLPTNPAIDTFKSSDEMFANLPLVLDALDHIARTASQRLLTDSGLLR